MKTNTHIPNIHQMLRLFKVFLILNAIPFLIVGINTIISHNYVVGIAAMLMFNAGSIILMGQLRLESIIKKNPGTEHINLDPRERRTLVAVRVLVAIATISAIIAVGRCMLGYWILVSMIVIELLTFYAAKLVRIHKICNHIISSKDLYS